MKLKKKIFHPKKVRITGKVKSTATKIARGARFGHRWFPYNKPDDRNLE